MSEGDDKRVITQVATLMLNLGTTRGDATFGRARVCADTSTDTHEQKSMHGEGSFGHLFVRFVPVVVRVQ